MSAAPLTAEEAQRAQEKAEQLLLRHLDAAQQAHYLAAKSIYVTGKCGRYLVNGSGAVFFWPEPRDGFVQRMGVWVFNACALPHPDRILGAKLWIEAAEEYFQRVACRSPLPESGVVCGCNDCHSGPGVGVVETAKAFFSEVIFGFAGNDAGP